MLAARPSKQASIEGTMADVTAAIAAIEAAQQAKAQERKTIFALLQQHKKVVPP